MPINIGVVMDPIGSINVAKDSTLAMLVEAQARGWTLYYLEQTDLYLGKHEARARMRRLTVSTDPNGWYQLLDEVDQPLHALDVILMRKDPPFDMDYIYSTYLLELAEARGTLVVNKPQSLRDANEKLFTSFFPQCTPETLVTCQSEKLKAFITEHQDIILKPLDSMGGASIFRVTQHDPNLNVIIETLTRQQRKLVMAQRYIPEITQGDKRILLINGAPIPYALARIPAAGETRANLAVGGKGVGVELSARDYWICEQVAPMLREKGLIFVGLDVIGDYLTEINVTSPTCIRELDKQYQINISAKLMDYIASRCQH